MAFEIIDEVKRTAEGNAWTSPERLCVTTDGQVVNELDPRGVRLLVGKGGQLTKEEARRHGLLLEPEAEAKGDKAAKTNKALKGVSDKSGTPDS